jgi:hypothetical protein
MLVSQLEFDFTEDEQEFRHWLESNLPEQWINGDWNVEFTEVNVVFCIECHQKMDQDGWIAPD